MTRKYHVFTKEFKLNTIRLMESTDKPITQLARELGVRVNQFYKWKNQLNQKQTTPFKIAPSHLSQSLKKLMILSC